AANRFCKRVNLLATIYVINDDVGPFPCECLSDAFSDSAGSPRHQCDLVCESHELSPSVIKVEIRAIIARVVSSELSSRRRPSAHDRRPCPPCRSKGREPIRPGPPADSSGRAESSPQWPI